ncbi:MAG: 4-alpha-glucanotransferase [Bdellovibrionales bacterium]|nr:4-alpha-glucanotransferase [Bdellovibrionales bacterium]
MKVTVRRLARYLGLLLQYRSAMPPREMEQIPDDVLSDCLQAQGFPCSNQRELQESYDAERERRLARPLRAHYETAPVEVFRTVARLPGAGPYRCWITRSGGDEDALPIELQPTPGKAIVSPKGISYRRYTLEFTGIVSPAFNDFSVRFESIETGAVTLCDTRITAAPDRFYQPTTELVGINPLIQNLSSRHPDYWGHGTFGDARRAMDEVKRCGGNFISLGPLYKFDDPAHFISRSPFNPISRVLLAHQAIDHAAAIRELGLSNAQALIDSHEARERINRYRNASILMADDRADWIIEVLAVMWEDFKQIHLSEGQSTSIGTDYRAFVESFRSKLQQSVEFLVLRESFFPWGTSGDGWNWETWPPEFQDPHSPEVTRFAEVHEDRIAYHYFLEWLTRRQLAALKSYGDSIGVGIMMNLPVGLAERSAETWHSRALLLWSHLLGCPRDLLEPLAQAWGFPPFNPQALFDAQLRPFVEALEATVQFGSGVEIDHGMFLERMWVYLKRDRNPLRGVYIRMPLRHLLRAISVLSHQHKFFVAPELIGTKSDTIDGVMNGWGAYSLRQHRFEMHDDGTFLQPGEFPESSFFFGSCHNHFPELAWLFGYDLAQSVRFRPKNADNIPTDWRNRKQQLRSYLGMLAAGNFISADDADSMLRLILSFDGKLPQVTESDLEALRLNQLVRSVILASHRARAASPAGIKVVDVREASLDYRADNMPGVSVSEACCWQYPLPPVEDWADGPIGDAIRASRRTTA